MEKRLTTTAMLFSVGFIFMLVCAVGAFFFGLQIGSAKIEAKYAKAAAADTASTAALSEYQQQDLVSFYHTVFSPYREFQNEWFASINKLSQGSAVDASAMFKNLAKLADSRAKEASSYDMQKSPLLGQAQLGYIRSLKLFQDAAKAAASSAKASSYNELKQKVEQEAAYLSAVKEALTAQQAYYYAMQKWAASVDPEIAADYSAPPALELKQWSALPLSIKNKLSADYIAGNDELLSFLPQDLTSRIDDFIESGQAAKMGLQTFSSIVDLLISTDAVRSGDFAGNKFRYYQEELLPQLPFFFPEVN